MRIDKAGTTVYFTAISQYGPLENATANLVDTLRSTVIPTAGHGTNMRAEVGGYTTAYEEPASTTSAKPPRRIMALIAPGFALRILALRTVVIPARAAVANVLSIAAAYGVLTAIFQFGWLSRRIGLTGSVPIVSYVPPLMFAILFGLSMDNEVCLVSQIQQHVHAGEDHKRSVISGLVTSARVTTSALSMVFVFDSFLLDGSAPVKQFGVGIAVAVILDAAVVRCRLVPAPMILRDGRTGACRAGSTGTSRTSTSKAADCSTDRVTPRRRLRVCSNQDRSHDQGARSGRRRRRRDRRRAAARARTRGVLRGDCCRRHRGARGGRG